MEKDKATIAFFAAVILIAIMLVSTIINILKLANNLKVEDKNEEITYIEDKEKSNTNLQSSTTDNNDD